MGRDLNVMKWVQISDTHLLDSPSDFINGVNPHQRLSQLLDYVNRKNYDLLILSGDLSDTGNLSSYQQLQNLLKPVSLPILMFAGNHDNAENLSAVFSHQRGCWLAPKEPMTIQNWQLLYLDTVLSGEIYGYVNDESLFRLNKQIQAAEPENLALFMHHNPFPTGIKKVDKYSIQNFDTIRDCLNERVKLVAYGHIHHDCCHWDRGIAYVACPSAAFQVDGEGALDARLYGLKEYVLENTSIHIKPIWFIGEE